ncbi:MAG: sigma-70 family RNA polymerase sigma factor [Planctomycetota bacterium]
MHHSERHHRLAARVLNDAAEAEDVCQRAYLKAIEAEGQIDDPARLGGWLTRVIINESLMARRRRQQQQALIEHRAIEMGQTQRATDSAPPLQHLADRESVLRLLEQLDEAVRVVVVLRTIHGLSGKEASQQLGCSPALVSRRLHQGLTQLRTLARIEERQATNTP